MVVAPQGQEAEGVQGCAPAPGISAFIHSGHRWQCHRGGQALSRGAVST